MSNAYRVYSKVCSMYIGCIYQLQYENIVGLLRITTDSRYFMLNVDAHPLVDPRPKLPILYETVAVRFLIRFCIRFFLGILEITNLNN